MRHWPLRKRCIRLTAGAALDIYRAARAKDGQADARAIQRKGSSLDMRHPRLSDEPIALPRDTRLRDPNVRITGLDHCDLRAAATGQRHFGAQAQAALVIWRDRAAQG